MTKLSQLSRYIPKTKLLNYAGISDEQKRKFENGKTKESIVKYLIDNKLITEGELSDLYNDYKFSANTVTRGDTMEQPRILDNKALGKVGDVLKENLTKGSKLSVVSAYFAIYNF